MKVESFEVPADPLMRIEGVTPELAKLLRESGYETIESIAIEAPHVLFDRVGERKGFTLETARRLVHNARKFLKIEVVTALELLEEEKARNKYTTGSEALDRILGGGIYEMDITEFVGPMEVGKTEVVCTAAVLAAKEGVQSWLLDTEGGIKPVRLYEIAEARGLNPEEALKRIHVGRVYGSEHLIFLLQNAHKIIKQRGIKLLALDSLVSPFRAEYIGREHLAPRQQLINKCLQMLINYMRVYKMAIVTTEQVVASPTPMYFEHRPELQNPPVGGFVVGHRVGNRVYIRMGRGSTRIATLIGSSWLPRAECTFRITRAGIEDVEKGEG